MPEASNPWKGIHDRIIPIAREAADYLREEVGRVHPSDIKEKGLHDYVTYVDRQAEAMIVSGLRPLIAGAGFLAEEDTREEGLSDLVWIIDPLDGTTNFIHHLPVYSVSIALVQNNRPVVGVVYEANNKECFSTWKDGPALLNGDPIHVSETSDLKESLLATGFPYADHSRLQAYLKVLGYFMHEARGIRRLGSAAVDLAYVACGRFDAFFEYGLKPWDIAAGCLLVENAGGRLANFAGGNDILFKQEIVASNPGLFPEIISWIQEVFTNQETRGSQ